MEAVRLAVRLRLPVGGVERVTARGDAVWPGVAEGVTSARLSDACLVTVAVSERDRVPVSGNGPVADMVPLAVPGLV